MRRRVGFLFICSAAVPIVVFAASAWACGSVATISSSPKVAAAGATVTVTGRNFGATTVNPPATPFSNVQLRWNGRTGPVLKEVTTEGGAFSTTVSVPPNATPGWYVVAATQFNIATGVTKSGSPGRTTVRVQGAAAGSAAPWGAAAPTGSGGPGSSGSPDIPMPALLLSVGLLATGLTIVARGRGRKSARPAVGV